MDATTRFTRFGFFLGAGTVGVLAGLGLGSKEPNKLALVVGVGSLVYANYLNPVVKLEPAAEAQFRSTVKEARGRMPSAPSLPNFPEVPFRGPGSLGAAPFVSP